MYTGNELPFLPSNILFTVGGAAAVLSTRSPSSSFARSLSPYDTLLPQHVCASEQKALVCRRLRVTSVILSAHRIPRIRSKQVLTRFLISLQ